MSNKFKLNWGIWIGIVTGIYVFLYLNSPLAQYGIIWVTFIALPIFFNGGAQRKDFFAYGVSSILGVVWGLIFLFFIGIFAQVMNENLATALSCLIFTACVCLHMMVPDKFLFNKVPAMFGGIAATFSQGGENFIPIMITLVLGDIVAVLCSEGTKFLHPDGTWKFLKK